MRKDHRGLSMIELIIVLAVLAILSTGTIGIYRSLGFANTKKAAVYIDNLLTRARLDTMSKKDRTYVYLYQIDGRLYSIQSNDGGLSMDPGGGLSVEEGSPFSRNISLSYIDHSGATCKLEDDQWICISFRRDSGAFDSYYSRLIINSRNSSTEITCVKETGRHWVN